jgi:precorrin-2 dehydrogenase/sirohydrochlorin ferrochelatase
VATVEPAPYPVNLRLAGRRVLVVGGGSVAVGKVEGLLAAGAVVHVVAPQVSAALRALPVTLHERPYERGELASYRLAVACTDDWEVNQAVFDDGEAARVWVNAADDPERCSYTLPARLERGRVLVTVSTGGASPALAAWLRDELAGVVGPEHGELLEVVARLRSEMAMSGVTRSAADWRSALDSGMLDLVRNGQTVLAEQRLRAALGLGAMPVPEQP